MLTIMKGCKVNQHYLLKSLEYVLNMRVGSGCHKDQRNVDASIYLEELMTGIPPISWYIYEYKYMYIHIVISISKYRGLNWYNNSNKKMDSKKKLSF